MYELENNLKFIKVKILINGVWIHQPKFQLSENLKIRRIKATDFVSKSPLILENELIKK